MFEKLLFICSLFFTIFTSSFEAQAQLSGTVSIIGRASSKTSDWTGISRKNRILFTLVNTRLQTYQGVLRVSVSNGSGTLIAQTVDDQQKLVEVGNGSTLLDLEEVIAKNQAAFTFTDEGLKDKLRNGFIPEDNYQICVDFLDVTNQKTLLNAPICRMINVIAHQAPILVFPIDKSEIQPNTRPILRWNGVSPRPTWTVNYRLQVFEIIGEQTAEIAFRSNVAIVTELISNQTQWIWSASYPLPKNGKSYAWSVKAMDDEGNPIGETNGQAPPFSFKVLLSDAEKQEKSEKSRTNFIVTVKGKSNEKALKATVKIKNELQKIDINESTDEKGQLTTSEKLIPDSYEIEASAEGYQIDKRTVRLNAMTRKVNIWLSANPIQLKGRIVSKHNGKPLSEVTVELSRHDKANYKYVPVASQKTEADGLFHFKEVADIGDYKITTNKKLYRDFSKSDIELSNGGEIKDLKDVAIGNDKIGIMYSYIIGSLTLNKEEGERNEVSNKEVILLTPADFRRYLDGGKPQNPVRPSIKTGMQGEYRFDEVPVLPEGEQGYVVLSPADAKYDDAYQSGVTIFNENDAKKVDLKLKFGQAIVKGTVTDDVNSPVANVKVELYKFHGIRNAIRLFKTAYTDENGKYLIDAGTSDGNYAHVTFSAVGAPSKVISTGLKDIKREYIVDTTFTFQIDVKGTVKNQIGTPLAGVKVEIDDKSATTNAEGKFEIKQTSINRGKTAKISLGNLSKTDKFVVKTGASYEYNAVIIQPKKRIILHIVDEDGKYVPNTDLSVALTSAANATGKVGGKGANFYTQKIVTNTNGLTLTLDMPDNYQGQVMEFRVTHTNLRTTSIFLSIPKDTDEFFSEVHTLTLNMPSFRASISGVITRFVNKQPISGLTVKLQGRNVTATTDAQGRYTFTDLKAANSYAVAVEGDNLIANSGTVRSAGVPFIADQNLTLNLEMRGIQVDVIALLKAPAKQSDKNKTGNNTNTDSKDEKEKEKEKEKEDKEATAKIFGFEVKITNAEKGGAENVVLLDGYFLADNSQSVKPIATEKEKIQIPFAGMPFNTKTKLVCSESGEAVEQFDLNLSLPVVIAENFRAEMEKITVMKDIIFSESFIINELNADDISLKDIKLTAESGSVGITPKANTKAPEFGIETINGKKVKGTIALGRYNFDAKKVEFGSENGDYSLGIEGSFIFQESPYKDNGKVKVSFADFNPSNTKAKLSLEGSGYVGADPIVIAGELVYSKGLTLANVNLVFKTGLGKAPMQGGSDEVAFLSSSGKLSDITMYMGAETEDTVQVSRVGGGVLDPNKIKPGTVSKHANGKRKFFGGEVAIKSITARSDQENILTVSLNGDMKFELFSSPIAITEFTINSQKIVKFVAQKTNPSFTNPNTGQMATTPVTERNIQRTGNAKPRITPASSSQNKGKFSFELTSITAEIKLDDPAASVFRIRGKLAFGIEAFRVKVGEIVVGGRTWGGSFGIEGGTKAWATSIEAKYVYAQKDFGDYKAGHNFGAKGSLWVNRSGTGTVDTTTNTRNPKEFRFAALFSYANAQNWSIGLSMSSNSKDAPGNFQINKLGGSLARAEMADVNDPSQSVTGWVVGGEIEMTKGEDMAVEASFEVQTGNATTFNFMGDVEYTNAGGTKFKGRCDIYLNFNEQEYSGKLQVKISLTSDKEVMVMAGFYVNGSNGEFAFMGGFEMPAPFAPAIDMTVAFYIGNAIQKKFPASLVNKGVYVEGGVFKDWFFEKSIFGTGIAASAGFKVTLGLGVDFADRGTEFVFKLYGNAYAKAAIKVLNFEVAGISAEATVEIRGSFNFRTKAFKARGYANLVIAAHINCSSCRCNNVSMDLFGDGVGAKVCVDVGIGMRFRSDAREPQKKFSWTVFTNEKAKEGFLAGADAMFDEEDKKQPEVPSIPQITSMKSNGLSKFSVNWRQSYANNVEVGSFRVQVSKESNFKTFLVNEEVISSVSGREIQIKGESGKTYYARVNAIAKNDAKLISDYTEESTVTMPIPVVPTAKPFSNISDKGFTMNWDDLKDETGYKIQISKRKDFEGAAAVALGKDVRAYNANENIEQGAVYYYRVAALYESAIESEYSEPIRVPMPIAKPVIKEGTEVLYGQFIANWEELPNCNSYLLYVSDSPNFESYLSDFGPATVRGTTTTVKGCLENKKYYYRVQGRYAENRLSPNSEVATIQTRPTLAPKLINIGKITAFGFGANFDIEGIDTKYMVGIETDISTDRNFPANSTVSVFNAGHNRANNIVGWLDAGKAYFFRSRYVYADRADVNNIDWATVQRSRYTTPLDFKTVEISNLNPISLRISDKSILIMGNNRSDILLDEIGGYEIYLYNSDKFTQANLLWSDKQRGSIPNMIFTKEFFFPCEKATYWVHLVPIHRRPLSEADKRKDFSQKASIEISCNNCISYKIDEDITNLYIRGETVKAGKLEEVGLYLDRIFQGQGLSSNQMGTGVRFNDKVTFEIDISTNPSFTSFMQATVAGERVQVQRKMANGVMATGFEFARVPATMQKFKITNFRFYDLPLGTYYYRLRTYNTKVCNADYVSQVTGSFVVKVGE